MRYLSYKGFGLAVLVFALLCACVCEVPRSSLTVARMHVLKRRVMRHVNAQGRLPCNLRELPGLPGFDNSIKDGWAQEFIYNADSQGCVTLSSRNAAKAIKGKFKPAEVIGVFNARNSIGNWNDEFTPWVSTSF